MSWNPTCCKMRYFWYGTQHFDTVHHAFFQILSVPIKNETSLDDQSPLSVGFSCFVFFFEKWFLLVFISAEMLYLYSSKKIVNVRTLMNNCERSCYSCKHLCNNVCLYRYTLTSSRCIYTDSFETYMVSTSRRTNTLISRYANLCSCTCTYANIFRNTLT